MIGPVGGARTSWPPTPVSTSSSSPS